MNLEKTLMEGNLLIHAFTEQVFDVSINDLMDMEELNIKHQPIKLTKDWLEKLGFNWDYQRGYCGIDVNNSDFVLTEPLKMGEWQKNYAFEYIAGGLSKFVEFEFVHSIQNFFFAINGKKLNLK